MLSDDDIRMQADLVAAVVAIRPTQDVGAALRDRLDQGFAHRVDVYRQSFFGRVVLALSDVVFHRSSSIYGEDVVRELVARYFAWRTPSAACMVEALAGMPQFLQSRSSGVEAEEIADLVRLDLAYWSVLHGPDRVAACTPGKLPGPALYVASSGKHDLYRMWEGADLGEKEGLQVEEAGRGVLLAKASPHEVVAIGVPPEFEVLGRALAEGVNLETAILSAPDDAVADWDETRLSRFATDVGRLAWSTIG
jgi:hypothetical protein